MTRRIIVDIVVILSIFCAPLWWITVCLLVFATFFFKRYYEIILAGLILDLLYGGGAFFWGFRFVYTVSGMVLYVALTTFKKQTRFYAGE
ncbi:MAG: hypothetical protein CO088_00770 [Candidatus Yonathbacteria bacterium CG_4_9_14_0_8_um_filter_46_47]|nr:MAG: hypothetical protein CO088_00770 [Candidatus Yonathbacteria bacterium CG_4_9_14_0_8_um_filter_46_47]PJC67379.1 MAG: hypothetical protein CO016_01935 [Candidatus Yonathbacteria bacterium CG_4_8_14_3_um_filter_46_25]